MALVVTTTAASAYVLLWPVGLPLVSGSEKRTESPNSKKETLPFVWSPRALRLARTWANPWKPLTPATLSLIHWPGTTPGTLALGPGLVRYSPGTLLITIPKVPTSSRCRVTDGADDSGAEDTSIDYTIEVTIRVSVTIDLSDWTAEDYETNTQYCASGTWTVDSNGRAKETRGQSPSIFSRRFRRLRETPHCYRSPWQ